MVAPTVTVLQLDTSFPRVPGDVACLDTYIGDIEIIRIPSASVNAIVSGRPDQVDIKPFEIAIKQAQGDIIVTSCGFLSYWQTHLAELTDKPFISSSLTALHKLEQGFEPKEILIATFDANKLNQRHLGQSRAQVIGLSPDMHLRKVISKNLNSLDVKKASKEITSWILRKITTEIKHIVLECTNLPPYKSAIQRMTNLEVTDILTCVEAVRPGTINSKFI